MQYHELYERVKSLDESGQSELAEILLDRLGNSLQKLDDLSRKWGVQRGAVIERFSYFYGQLGHTSMLLCDEYRRSGNMAALHMSLHEAERRFQKSLGIYFDPSGRSLSDGNPEDNRNMVKALFVLAQARYVQNDSVNARKYLEQCVRIPVSHPEALRYQRDAKSMLSTLK